MLVIYNYSLKEYDLEIVKKNNKLGLVDKYINIILKSIYNAIFPQLFISHLL